MKSLVLSAILTFSVYGNSQEISETMSDDTLRGLRAEMTQSVPCLTRIYEFDFARRDIQRGWRTQEFHAARARNCVNFMENKINRRVEQTKLILTSLRLICSPDGQDVSNSYKGLISQNKIDIHDLRNEIRANQEMYNAIYFFFHTRASEFCGFEARLPRG